MPLLDIFRRKPTPTIEEGSTASAGEQPSGVPIDACTEDWRIRGRVLVEGRLLDALNRREALEIVGAEWAPLDDSAASEPVPGLRSLDPFDILVVFAQPDTMPTRTPDESAAHRRMKDTFDIVVDLAPFQVVGTVHLFPGLDPSSLLEHSTDLFAALTDGVAALVTGRRIGPDGPSTVLVNRSYLTRVEQVDEVTMRAILASRPGSTPSVVGGTVEQGGPSDGPGAPEPGDAGPRPAGDEPTGGAGVR